MSRLRLSVPGKPVRYIDLGPAVGRQSHSRSSLPGAITVAPLGRPKGFTDVPVATPPSDEAWTGSRVTK